MTVPSNISDLSITAGSNSPLGSENIGTSLDDYLRSIQAILRSESLEKEWITPTHSITYASATTFTISGADLTSIYTVGRRVKIVGSVTGTIYRTITASVFSINTTVTIDSGTLQNESLTIEYSALDPANLSIPSSLINNFSAITSLEDADQIGFADNSDNDFNKKITYSDLKTGLINGLTEVTSLEDADQFSFADSSDSDASKKITYANFKADIGFVTATDSQEGLVELATLAEVNTGTDATRAVTPDTLKDSNLTALQFISTATISNDSTVEFTDLDQYSSYKFIFHNVVPATNAVRFYAQVSTDNGLSYKAGASDYRWAINCLTDAGENIVDYDPLDDAILLSGFDAGFEVQNNSATGWTGEAMITNPTNGSKEFFMHFMGCYQNSGASRFTHVDGGNNYQSNTAVNAIKFFFSSGNLSSGTIKLYGIK